MVPEGRESDIDSRLYEAIGGVVTELPRLQRVM